MRKDELEAQLAELRDRADQWLADGRTLLAVVRGFDYSGNSANNLEIAIGDANRSIVSTIKAIRDGTPTDD